LEINKLGRNDPCPCGSGKKYKKCCLGKKSHEHTVIVASLEPLHGVHYDKEKMEFTGLTLDNRLIKPALTYSQTQYKSESGKEKVISRVQDKVIPNEPELLRHLFSSFDLIIAMDTNTKVITGKRISATGIVHCVLKHTSEFEQEGYYADFPWHGAILFRNCPDSLSPEKFGWMTEIQRIKGVPLSNSKNFALVTDHDLDNHASLNAKKMPILQHFYLPENFTLLYGRGDGPNDNLLNHLVKQCDKKSSEVLAMIEHTGYFQYGKAKYSIDQIPELPILRT
jgi:hypothetical protein